MKFLCDRCKTRYSIGDDRVRGKILKIRCKNCANVITVREGMTDIDASDPAGARRRGNTQAVPLVSASAVSGPVATGQAGALGAAFASALTTKPPPALEEEWYVSIDGEQSGPFSLSEAQRWVGSKAHDADLHCWSEGFDDWLPVDKVSHFRGLRKKPVMPTPPPLPRAPGTGRVPAIKREEEPKPLFAATMASLEKSAPASSSAGLGLPPIATTPVPRPAVNPAITPQARTNGSALKVPAVSAKGTQSGPAAGGKSFDVIDQPTQIESPPFEDELATAAEPVASKRAEEQADAFVKALMGGPRAGGDPGATSPQMPSAKDDAASTVPKMQSASIASMSANAPLTDTSDNDDDDDLAIGEVSRVVNLADLMPRPARVPTAALVGGNTGAVPRINSTGAMQRLGRTGGVARIDDPASANALGIAQPNDVPHDLAAAPVPGGFAAHHRRGLYMLLGVSILLVAGVAIAVVLFVFGGENITNNSLAGGDTIDTTRPDDPLRKGGGIAVGPGSNAMPNPYLKKPNTNRPNISNNPTTKQEVGPTGNSLRSEEIEDMAAKYSSGTQRCYMRSQKGADAILIGDVKKIMVTLDISPDGTVKDVQLSQHAQNNLGKCLISSIKSWRFRASPGGMYKFSLQFVSG